MREYPFPAARTEVAISFRDKTNEAHFDDGSVARVTQIRNKFYYRSIDPKTGDFIALAEEPYEEALKKVQSGQ